MDVDHVSHGTNAALLAATSRAVRRQVPNNYSGQTTSVFSAAGIGHFDQSSAARAAKIQRDQRDHNAAVAQAVAHNKRIHPSHRELYQQTMYPETRGRLASGDVHRMRTPPNLKAVSFPPQPSIMAKMPLITTAGKFVNHPSMLAEGDPAIPQHRLRAIRDERAWSKDQGAANTHKGRSSTLKDIVSGDAPIPTGNGPIYPAFAVHTQRLQISKVPLGNPNKRPPPKQHQNAWRGGAIGWEGNRGLPTSHGGPLAKDGFRQCWPNDAYGFTLEGLRDASRGMKGLGEADK